MQCLDANWWIAYVVGIILRIPFGSYGGRELLKYSANLNGKIEIQGKDEKKQEQAGIGPDQFLIHSVTLINNL